MGDSGTYWELQEIVGKGDYGRYTIPWGLFRFCSMRPWVCQVHPFMRYIQFLLYDGQWEILEVIRIMGSTPCHVAYSDTACAS
jgi:hypothetical protein